MASSYTEQLKSMSLIEPDKRWSTGEGNGKPCHYSCLENPMNSMKRQKDRKLKDELPRLIGVQYATGEQWRNNSRENEETEPKQKQHPVVDVTGDENKTNSAINGVLITSPQSNGEAKNLPIDPGKV